MERPVLRKESRNGWEIVTQYENEGDGPWLIDLSHAQKLDYYHFSLSQDCPLDIPLPEKPGECRIQGRRISARLNRQQAVILNLSRSPISFIEGGSVTDLTDALALLVIIGPCVFEILETVTTLDLIPTGKNSPFVLQGPVLHIRSLLFLLSAKKNSPAILLAVPRGYGQSLSTAILQAGEQWSLSPAGEAAFFTFFDQLAF